MQTYNQPVKTEVQHMIQLHHSDLILLSGSPAWTTHCTRPSGLGKAARRVPTTQSRQAMPMSSCLTAAIAKPPRLTTILGCAITHGAVHIQQNLLPCPTNLHPLPALRSMSRYIHRCVQPSANGFSSGARHVIQAPAHHTTLAQY